MQATAILAMIGLGAVLAFGVWLARKRWIERARAAEAREAQFIAGFAPAVPAAAAAPGAAAPPGAPVAGRKEPGSLPQQKLLFEAAAKAAEAGEPALSIQLYARLIARYPESAFAGQARAAVEVQKQKLKR
jgi:hypothetical protein